MSKVEVNQISSQCGSTLTIGQSGDTVQLASGASQTGFGRTGTVNWDTTVKTAAFTAVSGNGYFTNTTSAAFTITLPASPSAGDIVAFADYANTWDTNNLTIDRNSSNIEGEASNFDCNTEGSSITFVYVDATKGWITVNSGNSSQAFEEKFIVATGGTITCCGNFKIHTFTSPGTFTVTQAATCSANNLVSHLVVAGGGGGGTDVGGGGGAGGYREVKSPSAGSYTASPLDGYPSSPNRVTVTATAFPITVGGGGAGNPYPSGQAPGSSGANSVFSTITSAGGGGGGANPGCGLNGGSGGGGYRNGGSAGTGNTPPVTPAQGRNGGDGNPTGTGGAGGGGGAGCNGQGGNADNGGGAAGGCGVSTSITGSSVTRAGGGGGGTRNAPTNTSPGGAGGPGGGGAGSGGGPTGVPGTNGTDNTGGGGGGAVNAPGNGGNGGSGIVVIRYKFQ
tara:strand:+ start:2654 stop:4003 length:1350 start_codon:yes stop_codon:yes gene_type:complete